MADAGQIYVDGTWVDAADGATFDPFDPVTTMGPLVSRQQQEQELGPCALDGYLESKQISINLT